MAARKGSGKENAGASAYRANWAAAPFHGITSLNEVPKDSNLPPQAHRTFRVWSSCSAVCSRCLWDADVARTPGEFSPAHAAGLSLRLPQDDVSGAEAARAGRRLFGQSVRQERTHQARAMQAKRSMSALARISAATWSPTPESPKPRPIKGATSVTGDLLTLIIDRKLTQQGLSDAQSRPCLAPEDHCGNEQYPSLSIALVWMGVRMGAMAKAPAETALPQSQGPKPVPRAGLEPARPFEQSILSAPCLPFHHPGEVARISIPGCWSQQERATTQVDDQSVKILVSRCHLVLGVTDVVHAQPIGRARYAGR
jgi:hypothetical protein